MSPDHFHALRFCVPYFLTGLAIGFAIDQVVRLVVG